MSPWTIGWLLLTLAALSSAAGEWFRLPRNRVRRSPPPDQPSDTDDIPDQWITQPLDHFHPTDNNTWEQRYQAVTDHYQKSGPVFLMMGNMGSIDNSTFNENWLTYAKQYNALMFQLEHRFYGESLPTSDLSVDNLRYLSSQQALADAAYFVTAMNLKYNLPADTKWIVFGGVYAGNLAAWLRYKYPHLIHAAVASSAHVLAKVEFPGEDVVDPFAFAAYEKSCIIEIVKALSIKKGLENSKYQQLVHDIFNVSDPIDKDNKNDNDSFLRIFHYRVGLALMYNISMVDMCDIMFNETLGSPVNRLAALYNSELWLEYENDYYLEDTDSARLSMYQDCTEFGDQPADEMHLLCAEEFGEKFTKEEIAKAVYRTNIMYGGLDIKATRVVYVSGSLDPWHRQGITTTRIPESPAIFITGTYLAQDMDPPTDEDLPALKEARAEVGILIGKWLKEK